MTDQPIRTRKKLIEVALPLDAINAASAREKSIRHGHPSTLHLWWARRPLAAARAVIFSQMVDDPSSYVDELIQDAKLKRRAEKELEKRHARWEEAKALHQKAKAANADAPEPGPEPILDRVIAELERDRLFRIIEELVIWENTTDEKVLNAAREEIWRSWRRTCLDNVDDPRAWELFDRKKLPAFHDPFAGGGALPLEAQRLGLEAYASDLNPVAVLINKAMIEIPPRFAGLPPVNPATREDPELFNREWKGAEGLAEDVRYYGQWMRDEAEKRIGHLYPKVEITAEMVKDRPDLKPYKGKQLKVIAWLWTRTVKSPNPAFATVDVPLASTWVLSTKAGKEAYVQPVVEDGSYHFTVKMGRPKDAAAAKRGTKLSRGANFECLMSGVPIHEDHVKAQAIAGRLGTRMTAMVLEGTRERIYLAPTEHMEAVAVSARASWRPSSPLPESALGFSVQLYMRNGTFGDLFTPRQLAVLTTLCDCIHDVREEAHRDASIAFASSPRDFLSDYLDAVTVYLAFSLDKVADYGSAMVLWSPTRDQVKTTFARNAMPMIWDFSEVNPFAGAAGDPAVSIDGIAKVLSQLGDAVPGTAEQADAQQQTFSLDKVISTDPPYYANIGYADLSDFFYTWLRPVLVDVFPQLLATMTVPKSTELVATPARHGGREGAERFFIDGMKAALLRIGDLAHPSFPVTVYYAYKQAESDGEEGTASTGWETFLAAATHAGLSITGTWPMRTEREVRSRGIQSNALASSIILVCRKRAADAATTTRREFVSALKSELPLALAGLQRGNVAPVDLAQAAIGPGMAIYTRYASVLDAEGKQLTVREALALINQTLDEVLAEQEGDFDPDTRWAVTWFDQLGFEMGEYGTAEQLSKSKNTSVDGMVEAGIIVSRRGDVRLLRPEELPPDWDPATDTRLTAWEMVHHLIRLLATEGEEGAAALVRRLGAKLETARELAYRLYVICERKKRAQEAMAYNGLVQAWPELQRLAAAMPAEEAQGELLG